jgi:hypothetical protein
MTIAFRDDPRGVPARVLSLLAKEAKVQPSELLDCIEFLLVHARELRCKKAKPPPSLTNFKRALKQAESYLARAEVLTAGLDSRHKALFDVVINGRQTGNGKGGPRPHARHIASLIELKDQLKIVYSAIETPLAGRPAQTLGGKGWTTEMRFAASVHGAVTRAGGRLCANRNDGGSWYRFLTILSEYSRIQVPKPGQLDGLAEHMEGN